MSDGIEDQQILTLPNGLRVVVVSRPFGKGFSACLHVRTGRNNDPPDAMGLAHLTEHLAFRGETKEIGRELSRQGVYVNAQTGFEHTAFFAYGHVDFLHDSLRMLGGVLGHDEIDDASCRHEAGVVLQEMVDRQPESLAKRTERHKRFKRRLTGDPNWRRTEEHRQSAIEQLAAADVNAFRTQHYHPSNAALAIVAPAKGAEVVKRVEESFGDALRREKTSAAAFRSGSSWRETPTVEFCFDRWSHIWLTVVIVADDARIATRHAAGALAYSLGGGAHSDYFDRFRNKTAQAYHAKCDYDCWSGHTTVASFVSVDKRYALDALRYLLDRGREALADTIKEEQLKCFQDRYRRWWEMRMEDPYRLADFLAAEALRPEDSSMVDFRSDADFAAQLTTDSLEAGAHQLFDPANRRVFVGGRVGPLMRHRMRKLLND